jgi:eukaryotic-like serine/threonine-protein kinase
MAHGNVQPGTVLIGDDGRVVLADARADESATAETDIRAVGAVLYCALTGHWPHVEAGPTPEPDALRDGAGAVAAPHQVRAGVPDQLDQLTSDLLNLNLGVPSAEMLTGELARLDNAADHRSLFADDPLDLDAFDAAAEAPEPSTPTGRKMAIIVAALLVIAIAGTIAAARTLGGDSTDTPAPTTSGTAAAGQPPSGEAAPIKLAANQIRIVDPDGNGSERRNAERMVDGDPSTKWATERYIGSANFGDSKRGMGVLIDLGKETAVTAVNLELNPGGATVDLRVGANDPGASKAGDNAILTEFKMIGEPAVDAPTRVVLAGDPNNKVRYLLVWISKLPSSGFKLEVLEISVLGR